MGIMWIEGSTKSTAFFRKWTLWMGVDKPANTYLPLRASPYVPDIVGWKSLVHPDAPTIIGWTMADKVHWKSSALKVNHLITILATGDLTLEFPWDLS